MSQKTPASMQVFALPRTLKAIIFDLDATLYTHDAYVASQIDGQIEHLAQLKGVATADIKNQLDEIRAQWARTHQGKKLSLGNALAVIGIPIKESVRWREELIHPEQHLTRDELLRVTLQTLAAHARFAIVTNNPVSVATRTLEVLGVADQFDIIVGLDTLWLSKPDPLILNYTLEQLGVDAADVVSVGDRYDIDVALPLEMGMGGILVSGVTDVYRLPELLLPRL